MQTFIARQPIFDQQQKVFAYELLFRSGTANNFADQSNLNLISSKVIADCALLLSAEDVTAGKKGFINVTRDVLVNEYFNALPVNSTTIELLENIEADEEVIAACRKLRQTGYQLALDDFVDSDNLLPLVEMADIIKVDFLSTTRAEQQSVVDKFASHGVRFLAEKVETQEDFRQAVEMGYSYFQGYFFCKPVILSRKDIPGFKLQYCRILQEINRPELDFRRMEQIIKQDMSLSFKLLRYINSASIGRRNTVNSIKQALDLLGEREVKRWVSLLSLAQMGRDKPEALVSQAVSRARMCELLAPHFDLAKRSEDLFLLGMFSLLDAILDRNLEEILSQMPIDEDVTAALLGEDNCLRRVYDCVLDYEKGDWEKLLTRPADEITVNLGERLPDLYLSAIGWADKSFTETARAA